jgi:formate-dependent nitrite reductase membrane component NrfD
MVVFFSDSVTEILEHLPKGVALGFVGICRGKDEQAVQQAAALAGIDIFILNIFLVRLSIVEVITSCLMLAFTTYIEIAWAMLFIGVMTAIAVTILDNTWSRQSLRRRS